MVLLVPDTELEDDLSSVLEDSDSDSKAELDAEELTQELPKEQQKVELDLEDAPFLDDDDEDDEEEEEEDEFPLEEPEPDEDEEPWYKKKKIIIPAAAGVLVLLGALIGYLLLSPASEEQPAEPTPETETLEEEVPPPPPPPEPEEQEFLVPMAPFWVERRDEQGNIRFLVCQFTGVTTNEKLSFEMTQKTTILRDAIYYYLRNKDLTFLSDKNNAEALKSDILSVVNQYLSVDRLELLLIEQYLVK